MRTTVRICENCANPKTITTKQAQHWYQYVGGPFVCDDCLQKLVLACAVMAEIKKAEADTRCFQQLKINPAIQPPPARVVRRLRPT